MNKPKLHLASNFITSTTVITNLEKNFHVYWKRMQQLEITKKIIWNFWIKPNSIELKLTLCFLRIWSHLLKKSLMENFIFCVVIVILGINVWDTRCFVSLTFYVLKKTLGRLLRLVKLHAPACIFIKSITTRWVFFTFIVKVVGNHTKRHIIIQA